MKTKVIFAFMALSMVLASCNRDEKNLFDQSASERARMAIDSAKAYLPATANGWDMVYFANTGAEGYHVLLKFEENGQVVAAAKNAKTTKNKYAVDSTSVWAVQMDYGPILTFNTYNDVMHAWADPRNDGDGYSGDYEFLILESNPEYFKLKGKKHSAYCYLRPMPADVEWEAYLDDIVKQSDAFIGNGNFLCLEKGGSTYHLYNTSYNKDGAPIFNYASVGLYSLVPYGTPFEGEDIYPYVVTMDGLQLQYGFLGDKRTIDYLISGDKLVASDGSFISAGNFNQYFGYYTQLGKMGWTIQTDDVCPVMHDDLEAINDYLRAVNENGQVKGLRLKYETSSSIFYSDSTAIGLQYTITGKKLEEECFYLFDFTFDGDKVTLKYLRPQYMRNGASEAMLKRFVTLESLLKSMDGEYKMTTINPLNPSLGSRLTSISNPDLYLDVIGTNK